MEHLFRDCREVGSLWVGGPLGRLLAPLMGPFVDWRKQSLQELLRHKICGSYLDSFFELHWWFRITPFSITLLRNVWSSLCSRRRDFRLGQAHAMRGSREAIVRAAGNLVGFCMLCLCVSFVMVLGTRSLIWLEWVVSSVS